MHWATLLPLKGSHQLIMVQTQFFCGQGCRNKELDDNQKAEVIGCHGSVDKPHFDTDSNLTKVHGEDKQPIILCIPESMVAGEGKSLFAANQMRAAGHIVNDVLVYGRFWYLHVDLYQESTCRDDPIPTVGIDL